MKVWNLSNCKLRTNLVGHKGYVNTVTISPDGSLCASGGRDGTAMLWDLTEVRPCTAVCVRPCGIHFCMVADYIVQNRASTCTRWMRSP